MGQQLSGFFFGQRFRIQHARIAPDGRVSFTDLRLRRQQEIGDHFRSRARAGVGRNRHKMDVAEHPALKTIAVAVGGQFAARHFLLRMGRVKGQRQVQAAAGKQGIHPCRRRGKIFPFAPQQRVERVQIIPERGRDLGKGAIGGLLQRLRVSG